MSGITFVQQLVRKNPAVQLFILGYFFCIAVGWLALQIPLCQKSFISGIDALLTAVSAISTTGLTTVDIGKTFSFFGQLILLILIQLGGIGYMVFSSFIILHLEKKLFDIRKINLSLTASLAQGLTIVELIKQVFIYTAICELGGVMLLYFFFKEEGVDNSLWSAVFHAVSAFCTTGFSLFSSNLEGYKNHLGINTTLSLLSLFGAFGCFLWMDLCKKIKDRKICIRFVIRIVQAFATAAILMGVFLFYSMTVFPIESSGFQKLIIAFFQVVSAMTTAGFNTVDIRALTPAIYLLLIILMLFGASLTGSGTGMRGLSFPILLRLIANGFRGKKTEPIQGQNNSFKKTQIALFTFVSYSVVLLVFTFLLNLIEKHSFLPLFFETASALCTVGFNTGITSEFSTLGKSLIIFLMLIGRTGILITGFAISMRALSWQREKGQESVFFNATNLK